MKRTKTYEFENGEWSFVDRGFRNKDMKNYRASTRIDSSWFVAAGCVAGLIAVYSVVFN